MKLFIPLMSFASWLLVATSTLADVRCAVPMADWQPRDAIAQLAAQKGWTVRRIKIDDGCYEVSGWDAQGQRIEVKIHPATLGLMADGPDDDDESATVHHEDEHN
tara:strand:- start:4080 stop:4394 length:315 start_codon:yes stop_codon:yes gene_type:complete